MTVITNSNHVIVSKYFVGENRNILECYNIYGNIEFVNEKIGDYYKPY